MKLNEVLVILTVIIGFSSALPKSGLKPRLVATPDVMWLAAGERAEFVCEDTAKSNAKLAWYRGWDTPITGTPINQTDRLIILSANEEDGDTYYCMTKNAYGSDRVMVRLHVYKMVR